MILYLEFRNRRQRLALVHDDGVQWLEHEGERGELVALKEIGEHFGGKTPTAVVTAVFPEGDKEVSWSTIREAIAVANALAFAWGVPAIGVPYSQDEAELLDAIRLATKNASPEAHVTAAYNGEPNVTMKKT